MIGVLIAAWLDVRSKPLRTFAAVAGMAAAVIAVVLVDAAGILSRQANDEYVARTYGRTATLSISAAGAENLSPDETAVAVRQLLSLLSANGVNRVSTNVRVALVLVRDGRLARTNGTWVSSRYPDVSIVELTAGLFPIETARSEVVHAVITLDLAHQLGFTGADAVGQTVGYILTNNPAVDLRTTIVRSMVIDAVARSSALAFHEGGALLVSDLNRTDLIGSFRRLSWLVHVNPADVGLVIELAEGITAGNTQQPIFSVNRIDQGENLAPVLSQQQVTARAVTWVALIVGGLGILGVGLATVRERGKDFGLRRALGASKNRVFAGVIVQTLLEVLLAATMAIPLSAIAVELFARQLVLAELPLPTSTALPLSSAARGLIAALAVGLIAGLLPAFRAARASVVQALRD